VYPGSVLAALNVLLLIGLIVFPFSVTLKLAAIVVFAALAPKLLALLNVSVRPISFSFPNLLMNTENSDVFFFLFFFFPGPAVVLLGTKLGGGGVENEYEGE